MQTLHAESDLRAEPVVMPEERPQPLAVVPPHPLILFQEAMKNGADPEKLNKLVDLAERVDKINAEREFNAAMVRCQRKVAKLPPIDKWKKGQHSKYAPLENIQAVLEAVYLEEGFALSFYTADCPIENYMRICCDVMHEAGHTKTRFMDLPVDHSGSMNEIQGHGSTFAYGQRYLTGKIFPVKIAGEDNDGVRLGTLIGEEQCLKLKELIEESRSDFALFMKFVSEKAKRPLNKLDEIPAAIFPVVRDKLQAKIQKMQQATTGKDGGL